MNEPCFYRVSIKGIVTDDAGRVLLAREANGTWDMLGGGLDHNEDPVACLKREVEEETGLVVTEVSDQPKYFITAHRQANDVHIANVIYQLELASLDFVPSDECQELHFFTLDEMRAAQLAPNVRELYAKLSPGSK